ncbi:MAG: hypothetical protein WCP06_04900 [Verrucomicrobiota bacterium]
MKPFETRYTEWVDGLMAESERTEFEAELARRGVDLPEAERDRQSARRLGGILREHFSQATAPALSSADFFNHQLFQQIESENSRQPERIPSLPLGRLIWAGLSCLGAAALFAVLLLPARQSHTPQPDYFAQFFNAQAGDPSISAVAFNSEKEDVAVLWLDGLEYLPEEPRK